MNFELQYVLLYKRYIITLSTLFLMVLEVNEFAQKDWRFWWKHQKPLTCRLSSRLRSMKKESLMVRNSQD